MRPVGLLSGPLLLLLGACNSGEQTLSQRASSDSVVKVSADDPAMLRAFAQAHATLDAFLARLAAQDPAMVDPSLKVKIKDGEAVEYFWVIAPKATAAGFSGLINNEPEEVRNVRLGQEIRFPKSQIFDWTYRDQSTGRMMGNFTACALLTHEPTAEAIKFKQEYGLTCDP